MVVIEIVSFCRLVRKSTGTADTTFGEAGTPSAARTSVEKTSLRARSMTARVSLKSAESE
jgi:hypothetical protein